MVSIETVCYVFDMLIIDVTIGNLKYPFSGSFRTQGHRGTSIQIVMLKYGCIFQQLTIHEQTVNGVSFYFNIFSVLHLCLGHM